LFKLLAGLATATLLLAQGNPPANATPPGSAGQAQQGETQAAARPPIKVQVNEVIVPVTVTDEKGKFIANLDAADFKVYEEGKEQQIRFFTRERSQPVVVGFLIDQSNAMKLHWKAYLQDSAQELVLALLPGDPKYSGYLISYGNDAELAVNTTSDSEKIIDKIRKMRPGGGSAMYDAVYMACTNRALVKGEPIEPRRVVIIIGDGHDNASKHTLDQVIELAQRNLVTIYGVSTVGFGFSGEGEPALKRLAEETGGRVVHPLQNIYDSVDGYLEKPSDEGNYAMKVGTGGYGTMVASNVIKAVSNVAGEVTTQYIIRYVPTGVVPGKDDTFRRIRVEVALPNVKIRTRTGYYPEKP
jgi:Ca-activated chloride channel homolog